jgi:type I restriction enzyme M protein
VGTAALIFEAGKRTESVWFYDLTADGFSLDDKRTPIAANDIPDLLAKWPQRAVGPNSYRVPLDQIEDNDWSLAAGRYKPVVAEEVHYDPPAQILREVLELEREIIRRGEALLAELEQGAEA